MKLEDILPEIRKGRKFRPVPRIPILLSGGGWLSLSDNRINNYQASNLLTGEFELEPEQKLISLEDLVEAFNKRVVNSITENPIGVFDDFVRELGFNKS